MRNRLFLFLLRPLSVILLILVLYSCAGTKAPYYSKSISSWQQHLQTSDSKLLYTVFLIGDVGAPSLDQQEPSLKLMQAQLHEAGEQSAAIFLGDNVYHNGLPEEGRYDREISERRLNEQLNILKGYPGEKYMIPGNHDWNHSGRGGLEYVMREQNYVNAYLTEENIVVGGDFYVPGNGCPGPYEVKISDDLVLIAIDSEWWLHPYDRPYGTNSSCEAVTEVDFLVQLEDIIEKNSGSDIMVVAHHPLMSRGAHGGFFSLKDHVFPLTMLRDWIYVPLPVIGSIYPFARKYGGILQDIPHPRYQAYVEGLLNIFEKYPNITYAAGHEHALEYFKHNNLPHIVSGSGCKTQYTKPGGGVSYLHEAKGFAKVLYYENGEAWVEFWVPEGDGAKGSITFRSLMYKKEPVKAPVPVVDTTDYTDSTVVVAANPTFNISGLRRKILGEHYREEWRTPVEVPVLDFQNKLNGLRPYQKGGGKHTVSLKVRNPEAREYVLRSIDKQLNMPLPEFLREIQAKSQLQDQISAQHPYGPLIIPTLADAANIFHTNPELVYIPNTPYLRQYADEFSNRLALFEEDADENHEEIASLGNATNLVGTDKVLQELQADNDNHVDEQAFARARLFDMLIGDWDRHEGQWRWVEQRREGIKGKRYLPVPRDRDQAFFKADGILPWLATRKWGARHVRSFGYDFEDVVGLNLNALTIDRTLTASVTRQDWIRHAEEIKTSLTDEVIEEAIRQWPENIQAISGEEIAAKLKSRREKLSQAAEQYYEHISKVVDVTGSNKHEHFIVNRLSDDETRLTVLKITKEGEQRDTLYLRTFYTRETEELRLYGLDGNDIFEVFGNVDEGIVVRIIGGNGKDRIEGHSLVSGFKKHTIVYDTKQENKFVFGPETKDKTSTHLDVNFYDRDNYKLPYIGPRALLEYNVDDGMRLGGGVLARTHKFRKTPYAAEHLIEGIFAFKTNSFDVRYAGDFRQVLANWNVGLAGQWQGPEFQRNFYGLGNYTESANEVDESYYRVRYSRFTLNTHLYRNISNFFKIGIGPTYDRFAVTSTADDSFIQDEARAGGLQPGTYNLEEGTFDTQHYLGITVFANLDVIGGDNTANPYIGMRWNGNISYNRQLHDQGLSFTNVSSDFSFYITPNFPFRVTWAGRIGGAHNFGDFRFYQANTLGGTENLRGYRRTRFSGRSMLYANAEARLQVVDANLYLAPAKFGVLALIDAGRVYNPGDPKTAFFRSLHEGFGGGIWADILNNRVIALTYTVGEDDKLWMLDFGFLF